MVNLRWLACHSVVSSSEVRFRIGQSTEEEKMNKKTALRPKKGLMCGVFYLPVLFQVFSEIGILTKTFSFKSKCIWKCLLPMLWCPEHNISKWKTTQQHLQKTHWSLEVGLTFWRIRFLNANFCDFFLKFSSNFSAMNAEDLKSTIV